MSDRSSSPVPARTSSHLNQPQGTFTAADPGSGYYIDLTGVAHSYGPPDHAAAWFELLADRRERLLPGQLLQLGLGAWQLRDEDPRWLRLHCDIARWAAVDQDGLGRFAHRSDMPHTYRLSAPWYSSFAQGLAASLFVRAAISMNDASWFECAAKAVAPLLDPESELVAHTEDGPVLQEYPTDPPAHVLNGWMWSLWGLYDVAHACGAGGDPDLAERAREARRFFAASLSTLVQWLPRYDAAGWSRYDLYPHPVINVASPFYQRLHVEMLRSMHVLAPQHDALAEWSERWRRSLVRPHVRGFALARKVGFRLLLPKGRAA